MRYSGEPMRLIVDWWLDVQVRPTITEAMVSCPSAQNAEQRPIGCRSLSLKEAMNRVPIPRSRSVPAATMMLRVSQGSAAG